MLSPTNQRQKLKTERRPSVFGLNLVLPRKLRWFGIFPRGFHNTAVEYRTNSRNEVAVSTARTSAPSTLLGGRHLPRSGTLGPAAFSKIRLVGRITILPLVPSNLSHLYHLRKLCRSPSIAMDLGDRSSTISCAATARLNSSRRHSFSTLF
jgi:hypothetical protein